MTGTTYPWSERDNQGRVIVNLPFDDGYWMKVVVGKQMPNIQEWLNCDNASKAQFARWYIGAVEGQPALRAEEMALRNERRDRDGRMIAIARSEVTG